MKYIGFDFGDGTTVAAVYDSDSRGLEIINILKGKREIPSYLAKEGSNTYIGEDAAECMDVPFYAYWKDRPSVKENSFKVYTWQERKTLTIEFMKKVLEETKKQNPGVFSGNCQYIIGIPSGWNDDDEKIYRDWAVEAGLKNVQTIRESQAAILYARREAIATVSANSEQTILNEGFVNGILMIDLGSSTTDFSYIKGLGVPKNYGINLGAHEIERLLLENYEETVDNAYHYTDESMKKLHLAQNPGFRSTKEKVYSQFASPDVLSAMGFAKMEFKGGQYIISCGEYTPKGYAITRKWLERVMQKKFSLPGTIEQKSWQEHFCDALRKFIKNNEISTNSLTVLVTGGASRMYFVEKDIRSILGSVTIIKSNDNLCSESVAMGLAWAGYANKVYNEAKSKNDNAVNEKFFSMFPNVADVSDEFRTIVGNKTVDTLVAGIIDTSIANVRTDINGGSINSYETLLESFMSHANNELQNKMNEITKPIIITLSKKFESLYKNYQDEFGASRIIGEMRCIVNKTELKITDIGIPPTFGQIIGHILGAIIGGTIGCIIGNLIFPLIGGVIGAVIGAAIGSKVAVPDGKIPNSWKVSKGKTTLLGVLNRIAQNDNKKDIKSKCIDGIAKAFWKERQKLVVAISGICKMELDAIFAIFSDNVTGNGNSFSNAPIKPHSFSVTVNGDFQLEQFEMTVSDSCMFSKGSCVVTGEILCGCICKNDVVGIIDSDNEEMQRLKVLAIEINGKPVDKAEKRGTRCGLLLNGGADKKMIGKKIVKRW